MKDDFDPMGSRRDAFDFMSGASKALHGIEALKQSQLLEEQIRLQKEALELEKQKLAQSGNAQSAGSTPNGKTSSAKRSHAPYVPAVPKFDVNDERRKAALRWRIVATCLWVPLFPFLMLLAIFGGYKASGNFCQQYLSDLFVGEDAEKQEFDAIRGGGNAVRHYGIKYKDYVDTRGYEYLSKLLPDQIEEYNRKNEEGRRKYREALLRKFEEKFGRVTNGNAVLRD